MKRRPRSFGESSAAAIALLIVCVLLAISEPAFLTKANLFNVLEQVSLIGIIAMGMTLLLVSANFDLSIGGIVGLSGMVLATTANAYGLAAGIVVTLVFSALLGSFNGFLVTKLKVNSLIATLGSGLAFSGLALLIGSNAPIQLKSYQLTLLVNWDLGGLTLPVFVFVAVVALTAWMLHGTVGGRHLYAVGSNPEAARLAGVRVQLIRFLPFVITGLFCGIASILLTGLLNSAVPDGAANWPLSVVAAVVVGGVSIAGGTGTVTMGVLGVLLIGVINNGLNLLNMPSSWQSIMTGLVLVVAVAGDSAFREQARRRALKRKVEQLNAAVPPKVSSSA